MWQMAVEPCLLPIAVDEEYLDVSVGLFADALDAARKVRRRVHGDDDGVCAKGPPLLVRVECGKENASMTQQRPVHSLW